MNKIRMQITLTLILFGILNLNLQAADYSLNTVENGVAIYLGVLPAEMLEGHKSQTMHGDIPVGLLRYHIAVALFDDKSGKRLTNALIRVKLLDSKGRMFNESVFLEPMYTLEKLLYGNYISLNKIGEPYKIMLDIEFPDRRYEKIEVIVDYPFVHI